MNENAYHVKQSQGLQRGKNDKVDAVRVDNYASRNKYDYKIFEVTNEFKDISEAKKFARNSGVVPFQYTSGICVNSKSKVSKMANHQMKALLHIAVLSSICINGEIQAFYHRKIEEGKNKISIINAIRNKIVLRVFACVKNNRMYQKNMNI